MVKLVKNRALPILEYVREKSVLEIGCVGMGKHDILGGNNFIAGYVKPLSKRWLGIDINDEGIAKMQQSGFELKKINAEEPFDLNEKFDIILAEEVMEHLSNFPVFLRNVHKHLADEGLFIITTPNPISPSFMYQRLFGNKIKDVSISNHTHWQTHETLGELLSRFGFHIVNYQYIHPEPGDQSFYYSLMKIIWKFVPDQLGRNLVLIAKKSSTLGEGTV